MGAGLREVAELPDPIGRLLDERVRPNGLKLQKVSVPIGVVVIIYESRPNVTADAASLCFKSGNATILRGGKEALNSNQLIADTMVQAAQAALPSFPQHAIQVVPTTDRAAINELLSLTGSYIPFPATKAEREQTGDPRPSLEERYGSLESYLKQLAALCREHEEAGYFLKEDTERTLRVQRERVAPLFEKMAPAPVPAKPGAVASPPATAN